MCVYKKLTIDLLFLLQQLWSPLIDLFSTLLLSVLPNAARMLESVQVIFPFACTAGLLPGHCSKQV